MEILDRVHLIPLGGEAGAGPTTSGYYVQGRDCGAFIDGGFPDLERTQPLLDYWKDTLGSPRTDWILVSHRHYEHAGGVKILKEATGARVAVGSGDTEAVNADFGQGTEPVDVALDGGEIFDLGDRRIRAVACPGHTAGTVCYLLEGEGVLFTGDHIMGQGTVVVRTDEGGSMAQHVESLRKLLDLDLKLILSGHGPSITDPHAKIRELLQHRLEREEQVLGLLREGVNEIDALLARIYGETSQRMAFLARHQVVAHLAKLVEDGRAAPMESGAGYRPV